MSERFKKNRFFAAVIISSIFVLAVIFGCIPSASPAGAAGEVAAEEVFLGGIPLGITARSDEFVVDELIAVTSRTGSFSPAMRAGILKGDIVDKVNGEKIESFEYFNRIVQHTCGVEQVILGIKRSGMRMEISVKPIYDLVQGMFKVGMRLKDSVAGIGTLTFVTKSGRYAGLGHRITDEFGYGSIYTAGQIFMCDIGGYSAPTEETPGFLRGKIDFGTPVGSLDSNGFSGIYGDFSEKSILKNLKEIELAYHGEVRNGKALILTTIEGNVPKFYDIEIIKAIKQDAPKEKSLVIRITDSELKRKTKGILQGMSGSPIVQNGKLIGAVTHVFGNDSTKGYGIYAEWMLANAEK